MKFCNKQSSNCFLSGIFAFNFLRFIEFKTLNYFVVTLLDHLIVPRFPKHNLEFWSSSHSIVDNRINAITYTYKLGGFLCEVSPTALKNTIKTLPSNVRSFSRIFKKKNINLTESHAYRVTAEINWFLIKSWVTASCSKRHTLKLELNAS